MSVNIHQRDAAPMQINPYVRSTRDYTSKPIAYGNDNGQFSAPWQQGDFTEKNFDAEQLFRETQPEKQKVRPFVGQLPYSTTPRSFLNPVTQLIPEQTRSSRVCFNEALEKSGPWYLRHFQLWDTPNAPFLPSAGDLSKDPRYSIQTKGFTTEYMKLPR